MNEKYLTVTQLTRYIHRKFTQDPYLQVVYLRGEISNYNSRRNYQNQYFKLKDENAVIQAVMFQNVSKNLAFELEEGMSVLIRGRVDVYEPYGSYQIYVEEIQPDGIGELFLAYEQTKKKLAAEGLFDQSKKKSLPTYPKKIGVITSASGAVIKDIQTTIARRYPIAQIYLYPTLVQGKKAADDLEKNILTAAERSDLDLLIVARGGGSFEDLFPFSEEKVVRAIAKSSIPVIAAIGHETDLSLAELASDLRAPTPTAAAEMATPRLQEIEDQIARFKMGLIKTMDLKIKTQKEKVAKLESSYIFQQPQRLYDTYVQQVDVTTGQLKERLNYLWKDKNVQFKYLNDRLMRSTISLPIESNRRALVHLSEQLNRVASLQLQSKKERAKNLGEALKLLSPYQVLDRGYAIITQNKKAIKHSHQLDESKSFVVQFDENDLIQAIKLMGRESEEE